MMPIKNTYKTKFSHQIFLQYFISAIIPILVLSFFSYLTITEQLDKNVNRQVYAESRALGLTLFDRLVNVESNLLYLSQNLSNQEEINNNQWLGKMFQSIFIYEEGKSSEPLYGLRTTDLNLSPEQVKHLENKRLVVTDKFNGQDQFLMISALDMSRHRYLVAILNMNYLWDVTIKESDLFCAAMDENVFIYCSKGVSNAEQGLIANAVSANENKSYDVSMGGNDYVGKTWELFIQPQFGLKHILIYYFIPKKEAFLEYDYYTGVFPQTIIITLLLVYVLSSIQMRRSLVPLSKLTQGVKNIIAGDYTKKVEIDSHNEFETLATTFNDMSRQINEQFIKINTLAKIDRLMLSTPDSEYIVEVLIEYIPTVIPCDHVAIFILEAESKHNGTMFYNIDKAFVNIEKTNLILDEQEYDVLLDADTIIEKSTSAKESYLGPLIKLQNKSFLIYPILNKKKLLGAIIIGLFAETYDPGKYNDNLPELADRAAVALTNAHWERKLFQQAHFDALTKLPNRYLFQDRLEQAMERAKRNDTCVAVLFIDLDRFKSVNDSLGHAIGDRVLTEVSNVLLKCVRSYDSVARFGGDEYTIILSDIEPEQIDEQATLLAERILEMMSEAIVINDREFYISPSIGIAIYPRDADNFYDLLKNADTAMYQAKNLTTGNYQFYQKTQNKETLARLELENELRHALERGQLELYYQPKVNLRNTTIYDVEALIRWNHPDKGMISPGIFIPLAEETGQIVDIGYWVIKTACIQNKLWQDQGINLNIAVNVSADQFRQPGLYEKTIKIIEETGVDPKHIELEITESITIENFDKTIKLLNKFKDYGLGIVIDDFGTGYSSMTYLQTIPINKLKIDKSFVDNIHLDIDSASITKAIVALAHNLDLRVVAEGVETKAQYDYLIAIGCDEAQGFFLCRPLPESELLQHIELYNSQSNKIA